MAEETLPKISIIVPVYKVEQYLRRCLDSIAAQTFTDWECILIDDGSPDKSGAICDEYAERDSRFRVIHQENKGSAEARNIGLQAAKTNWVSYIDSDDIISITYLETLYNYAVKENADIVVSDYVAFKEIEPRIKKCKTNVITVSVKKSLEKSMQPKTIIRYIVPWNKLIKADIAKCVKWSAGKVPDDEFVVYKYFLKAKKIVEISDALYFYRENKQSLMHNNTDEKKILYSKNAVEAFTERLEFIKPLNSKKLNTLCYYSIFRTAIYLYNTEYFCNKSFKKAKIFLLKHLYYLSVRRIIFVLFVCIKHRGNK